VHASSHCIGGYDEHRRSLRPSSRRGAAGGRDSVKAVVINRVRDYAQLEREFITTDISIRELCRRHGISAHSAVVVQAQKNDWTAKREAHQARASESFIEKHADRMADRQAEISDKALDAIDEAIDKFRADLKATKLVRQPDGSITEVPVMRLMPKDLAVLIDRFEVLFGRPSVISQHQGLTVSTEVSADALREFIEATRGMGGPSRMDVSPLPRTRRLDD
jgi:transposase-like protein